jgi:hypothetical protein
LWRWCGYLGRKRWKFRIGRGNGRGRVVIQDGEVIEIKGRFTIVALFLGLLRQLGVGLSKEREERIAIDLDGIDQGVFKDLDGFLFLLGRDQVPSVIENVGLRRDRILR